MGGSSSVLVSGRNWGKKGMRDKTTAEVKPEEKTPRSIQLEQEEESKSSDDVVGVVIGSLFDISTNTDDGVSKERVEIIPKNDRVHMLLWTTLKRNCIFDTLSQNQLDDLIDVFTPINCNIGDNVVQQGDLGDFMYVIEDGKLAVSSKEEGKLGEYGKGDAFGELSLLYNDERSATVTCIQTAKLWKLDRKTFKHYRIRSLKTSSKTLFKILGNVPLFNKLNANDLTRLCEVAEPLNFSEGDIIIKKGDFGNTFYIIMEGVVTCSDANFKNSRRSRSTFTASTSSTSSEFFSCLDESTSTPILSLSSKPNLVSIDRSTGPVRLGVGEWFGEVALLKEKISQVEVVAGSSVRLLAFEREHFEKVLGNLKDLESRQLDNKMLSELPIIAKIPSERREVAVNMFSVENYEDGDTIAKCGDINPRLIVMKSGEAFVWHHPQFMKHRSDSEETSNSVPSIILGADCHKKLIRIDERFSADGGFSSGDNESSSEEIQEPDEPPPIIARKGPVGVDSKEGESKSFETIESNSDHQTNEPLSTSNGSNISEPEGSPPPLKTYSMKELTISRDNNNSSNNSISNDETETTIEKQLSQSLLATPNELNKAIRTTRCEGWFDAELQSFEMRSPPSLTFDKDSDIGRQESKWRNSLKLGLTSRQSSINEDNNENITIASVFYQLKSDIVLGRDDSNSDPLNGSFDENQSMIVAGDCVGEDSIFNATPMNCTIIAKGHVTCFVLSRNDLISLLFEDIPDENKLPFTRNEQPPHKLHIIWDDLLNLGEIGAGTFGKVYLMEDKTDKMKYALKVIDVKTEKGSKHEIRIRSEIDILKQMKSPYICKLHANATGGGKYFMVLEYVPGGDFKKLIHPNKGLYHREDRAIREKDLLEGKLTGMPHQAAKFYIATISLPLVYLHRRGIAYRDLKPENIMIDRFGYPKLVDFGLSKRIDAIGKTFTLCGTTEYMAPEIIVGDGHNQAVDWWSLGITLYEMVVGVTPFVKTGVPRNQQEQMETFQRIITGKFQCPGPMEEDCKLLIQSLLNPKPVFRLGCCRRGNKEFEEHEWFQGEVDWVALNIRQMRPPWIPTS